MEVELSVHGEVELQAWMQGVCAGPPLVRSLVFVVIDHDAVDARDTVVQRLPTETLRRLIGSFSSTSRQ